MVDENPEPKFNVFDSVDVGPEVIAQVDQVMPRYLDMWYYVMANSDGVWHATDDKTQVFAMAAAIIVQIVKAKGLPQDLLYTPAIQTLIYLSAAGALNAIELTHDMPMDETMAELDKLLAEGE
jgi:hypothetical protein